MAAQETGPRPLVGLARDEGVGPAAGSRVAGCPTAVVAVVTALAAPIAVAPKDEELLPVEVGAAHDVEVPTPELPLGRDPAR